jgi:HEAT repeat protein
MDIKAVEGTHKRIEVLCCYARKDQALLLELKAHLMPLQRQGLISVWADTDINAGAEWEKELHHHLQAAHIILLLVSPDFMASDYCYSIEMQQALERHKHGEAHIIPVILRPTDWHTAPFSKLQALPQNAKPVTDWPSQDQAFYDIVQGVRNFIEPLVLACSGDESPSVALSYPIRLSYTTPHFLKQAVEMLDSGERARRKEAIDLLNQTSDPLVREIFIAALQHPIQDVRAQAAASLLRFRRSVDLSSVPQLLPALCEALDQETDARRIIVETLGELGNASVVSDLLRVRDDTDALTRREIVQALGRIGGSEALEGSITFLDDPDQRIRLDVVRLLGRSNDAATAVPGLVLALEDSDKLVRHSAIQALGWLKDPSAIPNLLEALRDSTTGGQAAKVLSQMGHAAIPGLLGALQDTGSEMRSHAIDALGEIGDTIAIPGVLQALHDPDPGIQLSATIALGKFKYLEAIEEILHTMTWVLRSISFKPKEQVITALASMGNAAIPPLRQATRDPNEQIRELATSTLKRMGVN